MTTFYRLGLILIYMTLCGIGGVLGYYWGIGGSILGVAIGAAIGTVIAINLNTPEKMENAFYSIVVLLLAALTIYLIVRFWGVLL
ncbi:MAG: hypothetical protein ACJAXT_000449 [Paracoccaceae bacterium]|jgi:hypothetical protein